ncbi:MAG: response regulator [Pseudomonadota bacterium]
MGDESRSKLSGTAGAERALHVLVVEDNEANVLVAEAHLSMHGHVVAVARHGRDGVEAFREGRFDVVLMDIQMPVMDGYEATRQIRGMSGSTPTPIIAVTAGKSPSTKQMALEAGATAIVQKPVDWRALLDLMSAEVERARAG